MEKLNIILEYLKENINIKIISIIFLSILLIVIIKAIIDKRKLRLWLESEFMDLETIDTLDGFEFEDYMAEQFRVLGLKVEATPKSGDFGADMIVAKDYGIQLKNYTNTVGVSAVQEIFAGAAYYDVYPVVLITNYYTEPAIELAEALDIELIDRDDIENWGDKSYIRNYGHSIGFYEEVQKKIIRNL